MSALNKILEKDIETLTPLEAAVYFLWGNHKRDAEKAAAELAEKDAEIERLKELLKSIEFVEDQYRDSSCLFCGAIKPSHYDDCELSAALRGEG